MSLSKSESLQRQRNSFLGKAGEDFAVKLLLKEGYKILERNFRSHFGEVDIVALKDNTLIFAEVKTRYSNKFGSPLEAVTPFKIRKLSKTAQYYSLLHPEYPKKLLIQVVGLTLMNGSIISSKIVSVC